MHFSDYCIQPEVLTATKRSNGGGSSATFSFSIGEPEEGDQEEEEEEGEPEASAASRVFHIEAFVGFAPVLLTISTIYFC